MKALVMSRKWITNSVLKHNDKCIQMIFMQVLKSVKDIWLSQHQACYYKSDISRLSMGGHAYTNHQKDCLFFSIDSETVIRFYTYRCCCWDQGWTKSVNKFHHIYYTLWKNQLFVCESEVKSVLVNVIIKKFLSPAKTLTATMYMITD